MTTDDFSGPAAPDLLAENVDLKLRLENARETRETIAAENRRLVADNERLREALRVVEGLLTQDVQRTGPTTDVEILTQRVAILRGDCHVAVKHIRSALSTNGRE